ncbi:MAG: TonB-dependent receptor [Burkholderiales bacterium]|nr:TonB-dependent receptor [Burkholderiales bacterium]
MNTPHHLLRVGAAALAATLLSTSAQACASCGCTLSSDWESQGLSTSAGWKLDLRYDYLNQDQLRASTHTISPQAASRIVNANGNQEVEQYTSNHYYTVGLDYSADANWGINVQLPYVDRAHATLGTASDGTMAGAGGGQYVSHTDSLGDIKIVGRYQGFLPMHNFGLIFGLKLPTGSHTQTGTSTDPTAPGPVAIDRGLQPGNGTTELIAGAYYFDLLDIDWGYFTQATVQTALNSRDGYRPGAGENVNAGVRYLGFESFTPQLQLNVRHVAHDTGTNADTISTGGTLAYLSPGVVVPVGKRTSVYGFAQLPIYQKVSGVQLAPRYTLSFGARFAF